MKKLFLVFLVIMLTLVGCTKDDLRPCNEAYYKYGQKALEIADRYLNYDIDSEEAYGLIDKLYSSEDELPDTENDTTHLADFSIKVDVSSLHSRMLSLKYGYTDYNEIKTLRDELQDNLSKYEIETDIMITQISTSNHTEAETTAAKEITLSEKQIDEIGNYVKENIDDVAYAYVSKGVYNYSLAVGLDNYYSIYTSQYEFAENVINLANNIENKYDLNYMLSINIDFTASEEDTKKGKTIIWSTTDHGDNGTLSYKLSSYEDYTNDTSCSLSILEQRLKYIQFAD